MTFTIIYQGIIIILLLAFSFGPAFFGLINTSIKHGFKAGASLAFGVFLSDLVLALGICILFHLGAEDYLKNEKKKLMALNKSTSKDATIYFEKGDLQKITFKEKPVSKLIPIKDIVPQNELLKGFTWSPQKKPVLNAD